jgi:NAD+ diphosphatase
MRDAETVTFAGAGTSFDRAAHLRRAASGIAELRAAPNARVLPIWRGKPLVAGPVEGLSAGWIAADHPALADAADGMIFLGLDAGAARFAADLSGWTPSDDEPTVPGTFLDPTEQRHPGLPEGYRFAELRAVMAALPATDAMLAATAKALTGWHATHRFCSACGQRSALAEAGWQRDCASCGAHHFPRTDPVVIMLVTRGNRVLLGRSAGWPEGMYSLLAGFVEPGETIEAAVRREVMEEAGVPVGEVRYLASQPWPYPSSLMIGCAGDALADAITPDPGEIEDAVWITREQMADVLRGAHPRIRAPRRGAIAGFILRAWVADRLA